jgi:hypothetical protein
MNEQLRARVLKECRRGRNESRLVDKLAHAGFGLREVERAIADLLQERMLELRDSWDGGSTAGRPRTRWVQSLFTTTKGAAALAEASHASV